MQQQQAGRAAGHVHVIPAPVTDLMQMLQENVGCKTFFITLGTASCCRPLRVSRCT
jgi:hypothetical protein